MPFMQGGDLRYHLREHGPISEAHVKFYAAELLCAMADLHAKRVVFRDLKPEVRAAAGQGGAGRAWARHGAARRRPVEAGVRAPAGWRRA